MVTSIVPIYNNSYKCENKILLKTLVIPLVDHKSRMEIKMENGRLQQRYGKSSTYILISKDAVISKKTRMFGREINIIGRICRIHESINATSSPSSDPLFEDFNFNFEGNITLQETCPLNGSTYSSKWTNQLRCHQTQIRSDQRITSVPL